MTKSEYIAKLKKAIDDSIELRWEKLKEDRDANVPYCFLCTLTKKSLLNYGYCSWCPINDVYSDECCKEWDKWYVNKTPENAQAVIDRLKAIDVDGWAEKLVKRGVIEDD